MDLTESFFHTILRSLAAVLSLQVLSRINGAKQISQLSFYDYITGITIGSMATVMAIDDQIPFWLPLISIIIFTTASYIEGRLTLHSLKIRRWIDGTPTMLISDGQILARNLKKIHLTLDELLSEARVAGYFQLTQIAFAIMESSGKISFLPYAKYQTVQKKDIHISVQATGLSINLIIDGEILEKELHSLGKDRHWLYQQLQKVSIASEKDVLLAFVNRAGDFFVYHRDDVSVIEVPFS